MDLEENTSSMNNIRNTPTDPFQFESNVAIDNIHKVVSYNFPYVLIILKNLYSINITFYLFENLYLLLKLIVYYKQIKK